MKDKQGMSVSMADLEEQRQDHANDRCDQVSHRLVRFEWNIPRVSISINVHLARRRVRAVLLHRMHCNIPVICY